MTSAALFPVADAYDGDPIRPDTTAITPDDVVAMLTIADRQRRMDALTEQAHLIHEEGLSTHLQGHELAATVLLFSGGKDSTTLGHIMRGTYGYAAHANTGIGIEQTRQFVRDTCQAWGVPLLEKHPPTGSTYRELVIDRGFPGPAMHWKMYQRLKERCLRQVQRELVTDPRTQRVAFIAGRRRAESVRRANVPLHERVGSTIWTSPIAMWTNLDLNTYRQDHDVPRNTVSERLCMSGECLCGAYARPGELDEIGFFYPSVRAEIEALEVDVRAAGHLAPFDRWGHGQGGRPAHDSGPMCASCDARQLSLMDGTGTSL